IVFNSVQVLDIAFCSSQNFLKEGILLQPLAGSVSVSIVDTTLSHNGNTGLFYYPPTGSTASVTIQASRLNTSQNV
ncbi:hypothetical protein L0M97_14010, partial [[Ruminococcus] torques]|uniref:hypothetical protein n=1 Tax=[Ruminococcus] torques TaxID=33039 RepID=UPI001EDFC5D6